MKKQHKLSSRSGAWRHPVALCRTGVILGTILIFCGIERMQAASMIYTWSSVGSGRLGTNSFFDTPFRITSTADASGITEAPLGVLLLSNIVATVSVSGLPVATFTVPTHSVANRSNSAVGIGALIQDDAVLFVVSPLLANYDLRGPIGEIAGTPARSIDSHFMTTAGTFSLNDVSNVMFRAVENLGLAVSISIANETIAVCWPTQADRSYQVQWSASLDSSEWLRLGSSVFGTGTNICVSDSTGGAPMRFYRIEVLP